MLFFFRNPRDGFFFFRKERIRCDCCSEIYLWPSMLRGSPFFSLACAGRFRGTTSSLRIVRSYGEKQVGAVSLVPSLVPTLQFHNFGRAAGGSRPEFRFFSSAPSPSTESDRAKEINATEKGKLTEEKGEAKKESKMQKLKRMWKEHGTVFVGYYATMWIAGYIPCYFALEYFGVDGVEFLKWLGVDEHVDISVIEPKYINALLAMEVNELFEIVRIPFVIATTPALSRRLKRGSANQD